MRSLRCGLRWLPHRPVPSPCPRRGESATHGHQYTVRVIEIPCAAFWCDERTIHIPRNNETGEHIELKRLFPCGEGAGYAGGIMSAAIDGEKCAEQLINKYINA